CCASVCGAMAFGEPGANHAPNRCASLCATFGGSISWLCPPAQILVIPWRFSMNCEIDELLAMVDAWKFKLYEKLKGLTPEQEAAFWKIAHEKGLRLSTPKRRRAIKRRRSVRTA